MGPHQPGGFFQVLGQLPGLFQAAPLGVIYALLKSHEAVDLLVIMLGTNDVKERLGANAACVAIGMERLCVYLRVPKFVVRL